MRGRRCCGCRAVIDDKDARSTWATCPTKQRRRGPARLSHGTTIESQHPLGLDARPLRRWGSRVRDRLDAPAGAALWQQCSGRHRNPGALHGGPRRGRTGRRAANLDLRTPRIRVPRGLAAVGGRHAHLAAGARTPDPAGARGAPGGCSRSVGPPALLHGATLPALAPVLPSSRDTSRLYAANTAGAVVGVLVGTFVLLPVLGVRGTELVAQAGHRSSLRWGWRLPSRSSGSPVGYAAPGSPGPTRPRRPCAAGACAMGLEVARSRLAALLLGGSVYAFALVLATFSSASRPERAWAGAMAVRTCPSLGLLGCAALASTLFGVAFLTPWGFSGPPSAHLWLPAAAGILGLTFSGPPRAALSSLPLLTSRHGPRGSQVRARQQHPGQRSRCRSDRAGSCLRWACGPASSPPACSHWWVLWGSHTAPSAAGARPCGDRGRARAGLPRWDRPCTRLGSDSGYEFSDLSPRAVERFAHDGWTLRSYEDG